MGTSDEFDREVETSSVGIWCISYESQLTEQGRHLEEACLCMAMRKHQPLAMHLVKHRNWLTEYSVVADIQRYRTRAMLARRVPMQGVATVPLPRSLSEVSYECGLLFLSITLAE